MSDALACFTSLAENAPAWIKSLDDLQLRIQGRQAELARVAVPATAQRVKKSSSNESIRNSGPDTSSPSTGHDRITGPSAFDSQQPTITATEPILATPSRKRKTASLLSAAASGIHKYRSRTSATVYYDSEVQEAFDKLVRNISTGRNTIRKSRMTDRITTMMSVHDRAQLAPGGSPGGGRVPVLRSVRSASGMPKFDDYIKENLRSRGGIGLRPPPIAQPDLAAIKSDTAVQKFDAREEADNSLDKAQGFCERGAHQFLRDGDCGEEVNGAKAAFQDIIRISKEDVERLKKDAEAAAIKAAAAEEEELEKARQARREARKSDPETQNRTSMSHHPALMDVAGLIEADDDEDGSEDEYDPALLPSPPFRLMART